MQKFTPPPLFMAWLRKTKFTAIFELYLSPVGLAISEEGISSIINAETWLILCTKGGSRDNCQEQLQNQHGQRVEGIVMIEKHYWGQCGNCQTNPALFVLRNRFQISNAQKNQTKCTWHVGPNNGPVDWRTIKGSSSHNKRLFPGTKNMFPGIKILFPGTENPFIL